MLSIGRHVSKLSGYAPALPTPFSEGDAVDFAAFEAFCELQISEGATALVVCGTTGEAPTLTAAEQCELVRVAVGVARGRVPVVAGAGSNSTTRAIDLARSAEAAGADALLSVVPYYNKPTQRGLYEHFRAIAAATGLPIILYDVPARTACGLSDVTVARLSEASQFIGLKDATGDIARLARLTSLVHPEFRLLSGDDATAPAFLALGGHGCISVTSNVAPSLCRLMFLASKQGQAARAQQLGHPIAQLSAVLFQETNPAPLKYALSQLGLMCARLRLPLVEPSEPVQASIEAILTRLSVEHPEHMLGKIRPHRRGLRDAEVA